MSDKRVLAVTLIYILLGCLWIYFSDQFVFNFFENKEIIYLQQIKGFTFVIVSGALIYLLNHQFSKSDNQKKKELDRLLLNSRIGKLTTDEQGYIESVSDDAKQWFGAAQPLEGKHINELIQPKEKHLTFLEGQDLKLTDHVATLEVGEKSLWVEITGAFFQQHYVFYLIRIDDKMGFQTSLKNELQQKSALIDSSKDFMWSIDTDMKIVSFNKAYRQMIEPVVGRSLVTGDSIILEEFGEALVNKWTGYYQRALAGESFKVLEHVVIEGNDSYGEISFNPIMSGTEVVGVSCNNRNITELKLTELKLQEETQRLLEAQQIGMMGDWYYDLSSGKIYWSDQVYAMFGYDPDTAPPTLDQLLHFFETESATKLQASIDRAISTGEGYELVLETKSESNKKYVLAVGRAESDDNGKVIKLKGVIQDVTNKSIAEREREKYAQRLEAVADNLPGAIFQYKFNDDGSDELMYLSKGSIDLWGFEPEVAMKNNDKVWEQIMEEDLPTVQQSIGESAATMTNWSCEWRNKKPDGQINWHRGIGVPRRSGAAVVWDSIIIDVTELKNTEIALQEREMYLNMIYENAFDGIMSCDKNARLIFVNRQLQEWLGSVDPDIAAEEYTKTFGFYTLDKTRLLATDEFDLIRALNTKKMSDSRFVIINDISPQGRYVEAVSNTIKNEEGKIHGAMVIIRDITEQYERDVHLNNAILDALEADRKLIASEIHDSLTQNLSIASMNLHNYLIDKSTREKEQLTDKIDQYLNLSIDQSRDISHRLMPKTVSDFGLVSAVEELTDVYNAFGEFSVYLHFNDELRYPAEIETQLFRITQEALNNVRKHAQATSCTINMSLESGSVSIVIIDDGRGFDVNSTLRSPVGGIGLQTMKSRILKLGGALDIESDPKGTSVIVSLTL